MEAKMESRRAAICLFLEGRQAELDVNSSDVEEVGTQMMVSHSNLIMDSFQQGKITSPKGQRARQN